MNEFGNGDNFDLGESMRSDLSVNLEPNDQDVDAQNIVDQPTAPKIEEM